MDRSTAKCLMIIGASVMVALTAIFGLAGNETASIITCVIWGIGMLVLSHFLRCPKCGRGQGRAAFLAEFCPYCGEPLE